jgi:hypothetical protein
MALTAINDWSSISRMFRRASVGRKNSIWGLGVDKSRVAIAAIFSLRAVLR